MNDGVKKRTEIEGKDNSSEDKGNYKIVYVGDMVYNSMRMWQGANGISPYDGIVSPAYTVLKASKPLCNKYIAYLFKNSDLINKFRKNSQGLTSDTWNLKYLQISTIKIYLPSLPEQQKIADFLSLIDQRIEKQRRLVESLKKYKRGLLSAIFDRKIRFKDDKGNNFPDWELKTVADILNYEQPQKYIVSSENYNDEYKIPVLTANKAFILGYTNEESGVYSKGETIIYDDFTMDFKFVDFSFKVKSSTIKMLTCKKFNDLYFMYNLLLSLNLAPQSHQRSYISILEPTKIYIPCYDEQLIISKVLRNVDGYIDRHNKYLEAQEKCKKGLLQQMFI